MCWAALSTVICPVFGYRVSIGMDIILATQIWPSDIEFDDSNRKPTDQQIITALFLEAYVCLFGCLSDCLFGWLADCLTVLLAVCLFVSLSQSADSQASGRVVKGIGKNKDIATAALKLERE